MIEDKTTAAEEHTDEAQPERSARWFAARRKAYADAMTTTKKITEMESYDDE